jgi:CheY-like chemotaxis protein
MRQTILVVDDNPLIRDVVRTMLESRGYAVVVAEDGPPALEIYDAQHVDAAIVDVDMPMMNGLQVCRELHTRAMAREQPLFIWLMTGIARPEVVAGATAIGASGVIAKPFTIRELLNCLQSRLGARTAA